MGHLFVRFPRALGRALGFWRVPLVGFAVATGRIPFVGVPFVGTLGVSLGLARTTMVTIGLRRTERTKRANKGMQDTRGRGPIRRNGCNERQARSAKGRSESGRATRR
jgi:hypothetical protein